ncbi:solute carrier organic anion transporter family member 2A1-like [Branchiostoma floridae]|uniref:Solute carrier organic anion transporter family member n=1 Tax=Branchiostoma floridae TaxID=7739 RepID=A0A9J7KUQ5_BRAFL|nr:solute carrier organic anion transporter family member 2A1-like [Branchiostoma floridae]XP_035670949.1 solute carrier organic anion transporter family member 2A1-like [Branchiostoma floridae]XP_035670950.1 solute carrier organic anion transporter family member 2A1-like [Branchiostoma floridae]
MDVKRDRDSQEDAPMMSDGYRHLNGDFRSEKESADDQRRCRVMSIRDLRWFMAFLCLLNFAEGIHNGIFAGSVTSIQRRFQMSSASMGQILSIGEIGKITSILLVTYFGSHGNRPRIIGISGIVLAFSTFMAALPHFLMGPYRYDVNAGSNVTDSGVCHAGNESVSLYSEADESCSDDQVATMTGMTNLFMVARTISKMGSSATSTLGYPFLDDHLPPGTTALYIGINICMLVIAPVAGFFISGAFLSVYVDTGSVDVSTVTIDPRDPRWVGAWWAGFLICSAAFLVVSIPFFMMPNEMKHLDKKSKKAEEHLSKKPKEKLSAKEIIRGVPAALKRLVLNGVYMGVVFCVVAELSSTHGLASFQAKFMEVQYSLTASQANFLVGAGAVAGTAFGLLLGGYLVKRFKWTTLGCINFFVVIEIMALILYSSLYAFGCDSLQMSGVTVPYWSFSNDTNHDAILTLNSSCNANCGCSEASFTPVCGADWRTYFSPCMAGCQETYGPGNFSRCSCIPLDVVATPGQCLSACSAKSIHFVVLTAFIAVLTGMGHTPGVIIVLRAVRKADKTYALGLQNLFTEVLAAIPAPIYFGVAIDNACLLWQSICGSRGACWVYDTASFRNIFIGMVTGIKGLSIVFLVISLFFAHRGKRRGTLADYGDDGAEGEPDIAAASMASLNVVTFPLDFSYREFVEAQETSL